MNITWRGPDRDGDYQVLKNERHRGLLVSPPNLGRNTCGLVYRAKVEPLETTCIKEAKTIVEAMIRLQGD